MLARPARCGTIGAPSVTTTSIFSALAGGALIGLSATALLAFDGKIAGISGITCGLTRATRGDTAWRAAFVAGLLAGGLVLAGVAPDSLPSMLPRSPLVLAVGGLLVGWGATLAGGCTSGHGVCGLGRRSPRSLVATLTFMATGILTVWVVEHWLARPAP